MAGYAAPELLVDTTWLAEHLNDPNIRIVEMAQDTAPFREGHIPGAVVSPDWQIKGFKNPKLVAPPDEARAWFESLGIGGDTLVVGYDRARNRDAARLWWVLSLYGHANVKVLNGGWKAWSSEGRDVETGASAAPGGATFTPSAVNDTVLSTVEKLKAAVGSPDAVIWDTRTIEEFSGEVDRGNARKGHVPGAVHFEWTALVNEEDHKFKPADELRSTLEGLGITPDKTVHTY